MKSRPTFSKRNRERAREEKRKLKAERREIRKEQSAAKAANVPEGEDPDIAGIIPGPQKLDPELFGIPDDEEPDSEQPE